MRFTPKTDSELAAEGLLPPGVYDCEVVAATDEVSKASGNDMIKLRLNVFDDRFTKHTVWDYLVSSEKGMWKIAKAALAFGLRGEYDSGELTALNFEGRTARCKVVIQRDQSGAYPDKNSIAEYIAGESAMRSEAQGAVKRSAAPAAGGGTRVPGRGLDDEIPFAPAWQ